MRTRTSRPLSRRQGAAHTDSVDRVRGRRRPELDSPRAAGRPGGATV